MKTKLLILILAVTALSCSKPMATAKISKEMGFVSKSFAVDQAGALAAARWALKVNGYSIANENQGEGVITSVWVPTTSDSHGIDLFGRRNFGANGAYYQLEVHVSPESGRTRIDVGARLKTLVANLRSTGIEERKVLKEVGNYLRTSEPDLTNLGVEE